VKIQLFRLGKIAVRLSFFPIPACVASAGANWLGDLQEIRSMQLEEAINERADEEMDVSDSDTEQDDIVILSSSTNSSICGSMRKKPRMNDEVANLKEENDNLKCQLEAYKNEVDLIRADLKCDNEQRDAQTNVLQQTLLSAQQVNF